jgi:DNA-binding NarL/FixJ family response regulator
METIRVSLVEDDVQTRQLISLWLSNAEGFACASEHGSAEEAIRALPKIAPNVVMMDINLPKLSGIDCVRQLKPVMPNTQFVMVTVYEDSEHLFDALAAGASGYLLKQTPLEELLAALRAVQSGGSPMTGSIARKVVRFFQVSPAPKGDCPHLSPRERQVLELLAQGYLYKEIAEQLTLSITTVNTHIRNIYDKLHVRSRSQAVARYPHLIARHP